MDVKLISRRFGNFVFCWFLSSNNREIYLTWQVWRKQVQSSRLELSHRNTIEAFPTKQPGWQLEKTQSEIIPAVPRDHKQVIPEKFVVYVN